MTFYCYDHAWTSRERLCPLCEKNRASKLDVLLGRYRIESEERWLEWSFKTPFIQFPPTWKVRITPPFGGAMARFRVWIPGMPEKETVSIYLDCHERLGRYGQPYWEVYPYDGDVGRCEMEDIPELLRMIAARDLDNKSGGQNGGKETT